jgi:hypothetical protein
VFSREPENHCRDHQEAMKETLINRETLNLIELRMSENREKKCIEQKFV